MLDEGRRNVYHKGLLIIFKTLILFLRLNLKVVKKKTWQWKALAQK